MIKVGTLAKIRRLCFRDKLSIKEICRQTGLSRNAVRTWLRANEMAQPKYPPRRIVTKLDDYADTLKTWLETDSGRNKRERRTRGQMWLALCALGYTGSYARVCAFARDWKTSEGLAADKGTGAHQAVRQSCLLPMSFKALGLQTNALLFVQRTGGAISCGTEPVSLTQASLRPRSSSCSPFAPFVAIFGDFWRFLVGD